MSTSPTTASIPWLCIVLMSILNIHLCDFALSILCSRCAFGRIFSVFCFVFVVAETVLEHPTCHGMVTTPFTTCALFKRCCVIASHFTISALQSAQCGNSINNNAIIMLIIIIHIIIVLLWASSML